MSSAAVAPPSRWNGMLAGWKEILAVMVPAAAVLAPILTGAYYLALAGGSGAAARQMIMLSDPVNTALSLTVAFLPALGAALATAAVVTSRGRFPLLAATSTVFVATVVSGLNVTSGLWRGLGFASALFLLASVAVPDEYPVEMLRKVANRDVQPSFRGRYARFIRRHRRLDKSATLLSITSWTFCVVATSTLTFGLAGTQLFSPQVYELHFAELDEPMQVVWFSTGNDGTWFLTTSSARMDAQGPAVNTRDLEWSPSAPVEILTCGLSASPCTTGSTH